MLNLKLTVPCHSSRCGMIKIIPSWSKINQILNLKNQVSIKKKISKILKLTIVRSVSPIICCYKFVSCFLGSKQCNKIYFIDYSQEQDNVYQMTNRGWSDGRIKIFHHNYSKMLQNGGRFTWTRKTKRLINPGYYCGLIKLISIKFVIIKMPFLLT